MFKLRYNSALITLEGTLSTMSRLNLYQLLVFLHLIVMNHPPNSLHPPSFLLSCWIQDDVTFYVSVVAYAALVFLFNIAVKCSNLLKHS